jgi:hypothetical protein
MLTVLAADAGSSALPWVIGIVIVVILLIAGLIHLLGAIAAAASGVATIKNVLSIRQMLAGQQALVPNKLDRPVDLVGPLMVTAIAGDPLMTRVSAVIAAVLITRKAGHNNLPLQYVSARLAAVWAQTAVRLPAGLSMPTEVHARPLPPAPGVNRMLVWFKAWNQTAPFVEYWTFVCTGSAQEYPAQCPSCGAPTVGGNGSSCRFCKATLSGSPSGKAIWLVDDITASPPAAALAA